MKQFNNLFDDILVNYSDDLYLCLEMYQQSPELVFEKTYNLSDDVEYIWNRMERVVDEYRTNPEPYSNATDYGREISKYIIYSDSLNSEDCKQAHDINPIKIFIGLFKYNLFNPSENKITISLNYSAVNTLGYLGLQNEMIKQEYPEIVKEFEGPSLKASIAHELTHWIDDTIHNSFISKTLKRRETNLSKIPVTSQKYQDSMNRFKKISTHEINSIVHEIKELKNEMTDEEWDKLTFRDIGEIKPKFHHWVKSIKQVFSSKEVQQTAKFLFKRLYREGLLGKNMKNF